MSLAEEYSREWFLQRAEECAAVARELHKALPGCFTPDGRAIVASAHLPRLSDTKKEQPK